MTTPEDKHIGPLIRYYRVDADGIRTEISPPPFLDSSFTAPDPKVWGSIDPPKCECGSETAKVPHALWCLKKKWLDWQPPTP